MIVAAEIGAAAVLDLSFSHLSVWIASILSAAIFTAILLPLVHHSVLAPMRSVVDQQTVAHEELQLWASVFQLGREAMTITGPDRAILSVNPAFTRITGYMLEEVRGKNPSILQSGRHSQAFYREMWNEIHATDRWQGEIWNRRKDGTVYPELLTINAVRNDLGEIVRYIGVFSDITQQKRLNRAVWKKTNFDALTNLPNRHLFFDRIEQEIGKSRRASLPLALLVIDLDRFKDVNDILGPDAGDRLLREASRRLRDVIPRNYTVARLGGDEFAVVMSELKDSGEVQRRVCDILQKFSEPFQAEQETAYVTASIGITVYPEDASAVDDLLKNANQALCSAKDQGRNRSCYFNQDLQIAAQRRLRLMASLRTALVDDQLQVHYQPIIHLASGVIHKAEALARWTHPEFGPVSPSEFIPIAEDTGLIDEISRRVFREAFERVERWQVMSPGFQVSVNLSPVQFRHSGGAGDVWIDYIRQFHLPRRTVVVEITEGMLLHPCSDVSGQLRAFQDAGMEIAIDDFGTGYSSFSYLKNFRVDFLKIDKSFVSHLKEMSVEMAICEAMIALSHKLGVKVIAEGIETREQLDLLAAAGCDYGQGFLFSMPLPAAEFEQLLQRQLPRSAAASSGS